MTINNFAAFSIKQDEYSDTYNDRISECIKKPVCFHANDELKGFNYIKLISVVKNTNDNPAYVMREQMQKVLTSMWTVNMPFSLVIFSNDFGIEIYAGTKGDISTLSGILESSIRGIEFETNDDNDSELKTYTLNNDFQYYSIFSGNPIVREYEKNQCTSMVSPIDDVINGSNNLPWMLCISAEPVEYRDSQDLFNYWINEVTESSQFSSASFSLNGTDRTVSNMNITQKYAAAELYQKYAQANCDVCEEAVISGGWNAIISCYSDTPFHLKQFGGMFSSQMRSGKEEKRRPNPFIFVTEGEFLPDANIDESRVVLSSIEMAALCSLPVKDTIGFQVSDRAEFDVCRKDSGNLEIGKILKNMKVSNSVYSMDINALNRHGLVIGLTGGGKTNTVKSVLHELYRLKCPFMIIEPAKKEYFELYKMGFENLQVYSVGSTDGNILKINPFEVVMSEDGRKGSLQAHIDSVFTAFKASFILYTPMPYVLENAIYAIYNDYGWNIETGINIYGKDEYPTIEDLYLKIEPIVREMGYDEKMQNDLVGSLKARINSLRVGAKGRTLNVARSIPMEKLLRGNVVVELDDVGDEDAKAFIISLLLMQIQECRKIQDTVQLDLRHMLLIEEAHRLLKNISSGTGENADPRGAAVEYFCNMLAELRSKGQGFIVIDQIPSKLAPDLIKNTNLKIIHRTVAQEDRELVGKAMNMTEEQLNFLSCLERGCAAVYSEGDVHPKLVKLPYAGNYESNSELRKLARNEIIELSSLNCVKQDNDERYNNQSKTNPICRHCRKCNNWCNPETNVKKRLADHYEYVMSVMFNSETEDPLIWMHFELQNILGQSDYEFKETEKCIMAFMLLKSQEKMNYTMFANTTESLLKMIYTY